MFFIFFKGKKKHIHYFAHLVIVHTVNILLYRFYYLKRKEKQKKKEKEKKKLMCENQILRKLLLYIRIYFKSKYL